MRSQVSRSVSLSKVAVQLALLCLLLGTLCDNSSGQNVQGLPTVGNGSGLIQSSSQMLIDATQFASGTDMCGAIKAACGKLGTANYPNGGTIDARGFTGNQVCASGNITTMLFTCVGTTGNNGGKLLLGNVNLYADGPAAGNYTDNNTPPSGIGTPALILPSKFWGIEGLSRGSGDQNSPLGTFISVCTGSNTPVGTGHLPPASGSPSCTTAFPNRTFPITLTSVPSGTTTMTITVSGTLVTSGTGTNVYQGELAMVKGNTTVVANNGTFKIQSIPTSTTITVTVPVGTAPCTLNCGNLILGTPILGFGPPKGVTYGTAYNGCGGNLCSSFGEHIKNLGFNCQGSAGTALDGCIGWQNSMRRNDPLPKTSASPTSASWELMFTVSQRRTSARF